jgi:hypothetical protein
MRDSHTFLSSVSRPPAGARPQSLLPVAGRQELEGSFGVEAGLAGVRSR